MPDALNSREAMLNRIRSANTTANAVAQAIEYQNIERNYQQTTILDRETILKTFLSHLHEYDAHVYNAKPETLAVTIADVVKTNHQKSVIVADSFPETNLPIGLAWQREGLNPPPVVRNATEGYLAAEDVIGRWIEERCTQGREFWTSSAALFADYQWWCEQAGERSGPQKRFSQVLENRGFVHERTRKARGFLGIGLQKDATRVTYPDVKGVYARA